MNERAYNLDTGYNQLINRLIMKIHRIYQSVYQLE